MKNKKIIFYVTRQYMRQNRKRTLITLLGIFLMVVMMTCVFVGKDTALNYLTQIAESKNGSWHLIVYDVNEQQYQQIQALDYMAETAVSYDLGFSQCEQSANSEKPYWELKAYSDSCFEWMNVKLAEGRFPQKENEVVISKAAIEDGADLKVGDKITMSTFTRSLEGINPEVEHTYFPGFQVDVKYGEQVEVPQDFPIYAENEDFREVHTPTGNRQDYTIVGVVEAPSYEMVSGAFYSAITYVPNTMGDRESVNVFCKLDLGQKYKEMNYGSDIQKIMGETYSDTYDANDIVLTFAARSSELNMNRVANFMVIFFMGFILLVSVILIYNGFNISFPERSRYLGMLSSVGATKAQKYSSVYYEAFVLLVFALPAGLVAGLGAVKVGMLVLQPYIIKLEDTIMAGTINNTTVHLAITPGNIFLVVAASLVTVFLSSMLPARKIGKTGPIESIRGNEKEHTKDYKSRMYLLRKGKPEVLLARNHLHRQRHKSGSIIRGIAVFMIVLIVTTFGMNAFTQMVHYRLVDDVTVDTNLEGYDYVLEEYDGNTKMYLALKQEILEDSSVAETKEWYDGMFAGAFDGNLLNQQYWDAFEKIAQEYYHGTLTEEDFNKLVEYDGYRYTSMNIMAVDDDTFQQIAKRCGVDQELLTSAEYPGILCQNVEMSTENISFENQRPDNYRIYELDFICDREPGTEFPISLYNLREDKNEEFPVTLVGYAHKEDIADYLTFHGEMVWMIINADTAVEMNTILAAKDLNEDGNYNVMTRKLFIKFSDKNSGLAQRLERLAEEEQDTFILYSLSGEDMLSTIADTINYIIRILAVGFVLFTAFICLLNLYNSIRARAVSRRREMAMLRSVGMEERQLQKMLFYENAGIWLRGLVWSLIFSLPVTYGIGRMLKQYFGEIKFAFPWKMYLLALVVTIFSLIIMTGVCYHRKESDNILEGMREE